MSTTPCGAPGSYATAMTAMERLADAGFRGFKLSVVVTRHNVVTARRASRRSPTRYGAQLRLTRLRPSGRGADVWDELHPTADQQRDALRLAGGTRGGRAHRRLLLPPGRVRRAASRPQPVRGGTGGLPGRPDRRRLRLPVRHPRAIPGRQRASRRWVRPTYGASPSSSPRCASPRARAPARRADSSTPAEAGAWRPSSSPGYPWTGRTPNACSVMVPPPWPPCRAGPPLHDPTVDHSAGPNRGAVDSPSQRPSGARSTRWPRSSRATSPPDAVAGLADPVDIAGRRARHG